MSLKLPDNHQSYYERIIERSKKYIKLGFWSDIDIATLELWLKNFTNDDERYLSALILDKIVYRNDLVIKSMFSKMFHIDLPNILEEKNIFLISMNMLEWEQILRNPPNKKDLPFRFTTITSEKELGDSGADYMRRLRKYYLVNKELIIRIDAPKEERVNTLIVIDDLIASGEQTKTFIEMNLDLINQYRFVLFMPLIAHVDGIEEINRKKQDLEYKELLKENIIHIKSIEIIQKKGSFFYEEDSNYLIDGENTINDIKNFYAIVVNNKFKTKEIYGHGSLSLLLILSSGIPDNTLPIIHETNKETTWHALFEKY